MGLVALRKLRDSDPKAFLGLIVTLVPKHLSAEAQQPN